MRRKLNLRFLLVVFVAAIVFAVGWFFLHRFQKNRRLGDYLAQATRAEDEKKFDRAARFIRAYILAVPADTDVRIRYAELLEKMGNTPRDRSAALDVYEQALRQDPDRPAVRRRAAELAAELKHWDAALGHIKELPEALTNNDGPLLLLKAQCQEEKREFRAAAESYAASCRADPKPEAFARLAMTRKFRLKDEDGTDTNGIETGPQAVMNELVAKLPDSSEAYLARAVYHKTHDKDRTAGLIRARPDIEKAMARAKLPNEQLTVLLVSAQVSMELAAKESQDTDAARAERKRFWAEARDALTKGLALVPQDPAPYLGLADLEIRAGNRDEALKVLRNARKEVPEAAASEVLFALGDLSAESGDGAATAEVVEQLKKLKQNPNRIDFLRGLVLVRQGQWYAGSGVLERIRPLVGPGADGAVRLDPVRIDLLLGLCYGNLGDLERQRDTYNRAVKAADPSDWRPRSGRAGALAALGQSDAAIAEYRDIVGMKLAPPGTRVALARLLVSRNLARTTAGQPQQWDEAEQLLKEAGERMKDSVEVPLLKAEILFAKGDFEGAKRLLTECRDARPKEPEFWYALASLTDRGGGDNGAANAILDAAVARIGDTAELRIARLRITKYASPEQAGAVVTRLTADVEQRFQPEERVRLLRVLASANWLLDRTAEAARLWAQVAALRPTELGVRLLQFDAALKLKDDAAMQRVIADIQRIEGNGPYEKFCRASRLIGLAADGGDGSGLAEARNLLAAAGARRPGWSRVPLALARIDELEHNPERMVEHLRDAVVLGERQLSIVKTTVQALDERGRQKEADELLRGLNDQSPISNDLQRLHAEVSIRLDTDRALNLARESIGKNSKDYKERVWLGRMLSAGGSAKEAEEEFDKAAAIDPKQPDVWVAYVQHMVRRKDKDLARAAAVVKRAEEALGRQHLVDLALCNELIGQKDAAEALYLAALDANKGDARAVRAAAAFYQQMGTPEKAKPYLRRLLEADLKAATVDVAWARRNLALALGTGADGPGFDEAIRLLDENGKSGEQVDDLRTRAMITALRPGHRQEVIALLEKAEKLKQPTPEQAFLLAQLYEAEGNWPRARDRLVRLMDAQRDNAGYVAAFARSLLRRADYGEAGVWIARLRDLAPNGSAGVSLQVQLWCRTGHAADCVELLREYAAAKDGTPSDPAARALAAADLLDQASWAGAGKDAADEAERLYAKYKALARRSDAGLPLASFYARRDAPDKALALCAEALAAGAIERAVLTGLTAAGVGPGPAGPNQRLEQVLPIGLSATSGAAARADHFAQVEGWMNQALARNPKSVDLLFLLGTLRELQGKFADAEAEYRKVLGTVSTHTPTINNLAFLLALSGKGGEAVQVVQRAFSAVSGVPPELLDTRAVASFAAGDLAAARKDLEAATAANGSPVAYFHLALVLSKSEDTPKMKAKAVAALRQGRNAGLRPALLHPLERATYEKLVAELKP
jgi:predicted Zn-dependent protease